MTGIYETLDGCQYEVFIHQPDKRIKPETKIRCVKSTIRDGPFESFKPLDGQIERNLNAHTWKKIA